MALARLVLPGHVELQLGDERLSGREGEHVQRLVNGRLRHLPDQGKGPIGV